MRTSELRYAVVGSKDINGRLQRDFDNLLWESLHIDFDGHPDDDLFSLAARLSRNRFNPNRAVREGDMRAGQRFGRVVMALAIHDGELVAAVPYAHNVSADGHNSLPKPADAALQHAERFAKLYAPFGRLHGKPLVESRYGWFGQTALSAEARWNIRESGGEAFNVVDGLMTAVRIKTRPHDKQPASVYLYSEEKAMRLAVEANGFTLQSAGTAHPLDNGRATEIGWWKARNFEDIGAKIIMKPDAVDMLEDIYGQIHGH